MRPLIYPGSDHDESEGDDLPSSEFDLNREGLPPFAEGGAPLPDSHIPHTESRIPYHTAYRKVDHTGMQTFGFLRLKEEV
jgi:hypothetical protein